MNKFIIFFLLLSIIFLSLNYNFLKDIYWGLRIKYLLKEVEKKVSKNESLLLIFIRKNLIDYRGLIASEIKMGLPSEYSLLESFGELLEYSILINDKKLFDALYRNVKRYFLSKNGYFYWRINMKTLVPDKATSMLDSIRILYSLVRASYVFKDKNYLEEARKVLQGILKYNIHKNLLVDFYDERVQRTSTTISLYYLDLDKIFYIAREFPEFREYYESSKELLLRSLNYSYTFFPVKFDLIENKFLIPEDVNMIEQSLIALYIKNNKLFKKFLNFVNMEINKYKNISIRYNRMGKRITNKESSGIYALLLRLYYNLGERSHINKIRSFLKKFEGERLGMGDHYNYSFYTFDQLEYLLTLVIMRGKL
ncbi:MAG: glycosyl hydrolase family 8 [Dictyoglomaceae bacterium]|nr:glycosyl hydrolase family 8 [Dictyoglomaceae bacterium]